MPVSPLTRFTELPAEAKQNLLLGNGFSSRIFGRFGYGSLLEEARQKGFFGPEVEGVFGEFDTSDFEYVLSQLWTCVRVATRLGLSPEPFLGKYALVREALARAIRSVHPRSDLLEREALAQCARRLREQYRAVFTLNYDLLLYWSFAADSFAGVGDFFWTGDLRFDPATCSERDGQVPVFYLHGALFLSSDENGTSKLRSEWGRNLLEQIEERWKAGSVPVFVSEGSWEQKVRAIRRDSYLSFALTRFSQIKGGLTVFGAGLGESDQHIVDAVVANRGLNTIAVSIRSGTDEERATQIQRAEDRLRRATGRGARLYCFDADEFAAALSLPTVVDTPPPAALAEASPSPT